MTHPDPRRPTDAELRILQVLWERGPSTVRDVHEALEAGAAEGQATGYTTVLKQMQIMLEKGLLERDASRRTHVYAPARSQDHTQRQLLRHIVERAFSGSAGSLALAALSAQRATPEEAAAIRDLLDRAEAGRGEAGRGDGPGSQGAPATTEPTPDDGSDGADDRHDPEPDA